MFLLLLPYILLTGAVTAHCPPAAFRNEAKHTCNITHVTSHDRLWRWKGEKISSSLLYMTFHLKHFPSAPLSLRIMFELQRRKLIRYCPNTHTRRKKVRVLMWGRHLCHRDSFRFLLQISRKLFDYCFAVCHSHTSNHCTSFSFPPMNHLTAPHMSLLALWRARTQRLGTSALN